MNKIVILSGFLYSVLILAGCQVNLEGNEGNLLFSYLSGTSCDVPIAVGAKRVVKVREINEETIVISNATGDNDAVVSVGQISGDEIILEALAEGGIRLDVEAQTGESVLADNINLETKIADQTSLNPSCGDASSIFLFEQKTQRVSFSLFSDEKAIGGFGYYPFDLSAGRIEYDTQDPRFLHFSLPDEMPASKEIRISSKIDDTELVIPLITESDIDEVSVGVTAAPIENRTCFSLIVKSGSDEICRAAPQFELESLTPEICEPTNSEDLEPSLILFGESWACVTPKMEGECNLKISLPYANDGVGVSVDHSLEVELSE